MGKSSSMSFVKCYGGWILMHNQEKIKAKRGKVCIINKDGKVVIRPEVDVDTLYYPSYGYCQVKKNGKYGYINENGELAIPFKYKKAYPFSESGLAFVVCENGLGGYINTEGEFVIPPKFLSGSTFRFGFAAVKEKSGKYKFIHQNGNQAVKGIFNYASGFSECVLAVVQEADGRYVLMDTTTRPIVRLKEGCVLEDFKEHSRITKFRDENGREALINAAGNVITGFCEEIIISPYARLNPFRFKGLWGYMEDTGEVIIPSIYLEASEFTEDKVALVKAFDPLAETGANEFYINEEDEIIDKKIIESKRENLSNNFYKVSRYKRGLALAEEKIKEKCPYTN